jgi:hypothetical protein
MKKQSLPITGREARFSVGTPTSRSSNSWKIQISKKGDIYIICRDNFNDSKISLHASGTWRYAFEDSIAKKRPDLVPPGNDRAIHKWKAPDGWQKKPIVAFELHVPNSGLYLSPSDRTDWKKSVVFIEPHKEPQIMTVVQLVISPSNILCDAKEKEGGIIAKLELPKQLYAMIAVCFIDATIHNHHLHQWRDHINSSKKINDIALENSDGVITLHGFNEYGTMFIMPLPLKKFLS